MINSDCELRMECLARSVALFQALKPGGAKTTDVLEFAKKLYDWVTDDNGGKSARDL